MLYISFCFAFGSVLISVIFPVQNFDSSVLERTIISSPREIDVIDVSSIVPLTLNSPDCEISIKAVALPCASVLFSLIALIIPVVLASTSAVSISFCFAAKSNCFCWIDNCATRISFSAIATWLVSPLALYSEIALFLSVIVPLNDSISRLIELICFCASETS